MTRNQKDFTPDANLEMKDAGLVAASAAATVDAAAKILDLGAARVDGRVIIDISALEVATGDERYDIEFQLSDKSDFADTILTQASLPTGDATQLIGDTDTPVGRHELHVCNEINGTVYRYARLYTVVAGTIATGINYTAWLALDA